MTNNAYTAINDRTGGSRAFRVATIVVLLVAFAIEVVLKLTKFGLHATTHGSFPVFVGAVLFVLVSFVMWIRRELHLPQDFSRGTEKFIFCLLASVYTAALLLVANLNF
jgi:uncharacterized membrane protein YvlD (DUF360 family)